MKPCDYAPTLASYALEALTPKEAADVEVHVASCASCAEALAALRATVRSLALRLAGVFRARPSLRDRLAERIAKETGEHLPPQSSSWVEPEWEEVSPGLFYKMLSSDEDGHRVSLLVRLHPGAEYPPHEHAGTEELFLLDGELWIDDKKLHPGDYNRAEAPSADKRVWSETGCTCVLVTSTRDQLR